MGGGHVDTIAGVRPQGLCRGGFPCMGRADGWKSLWRVCLKVAATSISAHMIHAHAALARLTVAKKLADDYWWVLRTESFDCLMDGTRPAECSSALLVHA